MMTTSELYQLQPSIDDAAVIIAEALDGLDPETEMQYIKGAYTGNGRVYENHPYYVQIIAPLKEAWLKRHG